MSRHDCGPLEKSALKQSSSAPELVALDEQVLHFFPEGADTLVEASGSNLALSESWNSVRPNGVVTAVALYSRAIELDLTQFLRKQIDLRTSYASSKDDYLKAFGLLQAGCRRPRRPY